MNIQSSRSHAIFAIAIECSEKGIDGQSQLRVGRLNLASSETRSASGVCLLGPNLQT